MMAGLLQEIAEDHIIRILPNNPEMWIPTKELTVKEDAGYVVRQIMCPTVADMAKRSPAINAMDWVIRPNIVIIKDVAMMVVPTNQSHWLQWDLSVINWNLQASSPLKSQLHQVNLNKDSRLAV